MNSKNGCVCDECLLLLIGKCFTFRHSVLAVFVRRNKNLSDQDVTRVKGYLQSFRVSDRDVDGKLNRTELEDLLYRVKKLSKNIDVGQLISEVDTSNTGFITLTNFLDAAFGTSSSNLAELLREGASIPPEEMKRRRGRPKN
jgi:Ca2+-binding EF-hand superfamily protein